MKNLLQVVLYSLLLPFLLKADCPPDGCGDFGECLLDTRGCGDDCNERCQCQPGYIDTGKDGCSLRFETCPDSVDPQDSMSTCYNGGKCRHVYVPIGGDGDEEVKIWRCDCTTAKGKAAVAYSGHQCELPATASCIIGQEESNYAFCVNNRECKETVKLGEPHPGCECGDDYAGRHCQYDAESAPVEEFFQATYSSGDEKDGMSGWGIFALVLVACVFVIAVTLFAFRNRNEVEQTSESTAFPNNLKLEETNKDYEDNEEVEMI